jgi:hypothetical protein
LVVIRTKKESRTYLDVMGYGDSTLDEESDCSLSQEKRSDRLLFRFLVGKEMAANKKLLK